MKLNNGFNNVCVKKNVLLMIEFCDVEILRYSPL